MSDPKSWLEARARSKTDLIMDLDEGEVDTNIAAQLIRAAIVEVAREFAVRAICKLWEPVIGVNGEHQGISGPGDYVFGSKVKTDTYLANTTSDAIKAAEVDDE